MDVGGYSWEKHKASTTTGNKFRPDFVGVLSNGIVFLRGEEKSDQHSVDLALSELNSKMAEWSAHLYGYLPYVFGYAAAGSIIQICVIHPHENSTIHKHVTPIVKYDITNKTSRSCLLQNLLWICTLAPLMTQHLPNGVRTHAFATLVRQNKKVTLVFDEDSVTKNFYFSEQECLSLRDKFDLLKQLKCKNIPEITQVKITNSVLQVTTKPIGLVAIPTTKQQLKQAIISVIMALQALHGIGYCHGDIRWDNIVLLAEYRSGFLNTDQWMLIDYDLSAPTGTTNITWASHPFKKQKLTFSADWFQVGELLTSPSLGNQFEELNEQRQILKKYFQSDQFDPSQAGAQVSHYLN
eukprot:c19247_g1_i4.p1 GENE.c19247_g1_i4~~c19247_g1_i4.p1  ORF type:complete len:352 (+),score=42.80 c19247_g1_i4:379-1434(+)